MATAGGIEIGKADTLEVLKSGGIEASEILEFFEAIKTNDIKVLGPYFNNERTNLKKFLEAVYFVKQNIGYEPQEPENAALGLAFGYKQFELFIRLLGLCEKLNVKTDLTFWFNKIIRNSIFNFEALNGYRVVLSTLFSKGVKVTCEAILLVANNTPPLPTDSKDYDDSVLFLKCLLAQYDWVDCEPILNFKNNSYSRIKDNILQILRQAYETRNDGSTISSSTSNKPENKDAKSELKQHSPNSAGTTTTSSSAGSAASSSSTSSTSNLKPLETTTSSNTGNASSSSNVGSSSSSAPTSLTSGSVAAPLSSSMASSVLSSEQKITAGASNANTTSSSASLSSSAAASISGASASQISSTAVTSRP